MSRIPTKHEVLDAVPVQSPADPIPFNSRLVSKVNRRHLNQDANLTAIQLTAGRYFIKCDLTVSGDNIPAYAALPGLSVNYSNVPYGHETGTAPRTATGATIRSLENGDTVSSSVSIDHDGQSCLNIRLAGTSYQPNQNWEFAADVSVHRIQ
jgi:hypothetical protein